MSTRPIYSIRFPLVKEKTGRRHGPRYRLVPDGTGLFGARACACGSVRSAMGYRDFHISSNPIAAKLDRLHMRGMALWARLFAGQIQDNDPRLLAVETASRELMQRLMAQYAA